MWLSVFIIVAAALSAGYFSGIETGFYALNRIRLRYRAEQREPRAVLIRNLLADPEGVVATTLVGHNIAVYIATAVCTHSLEGTSFIDAELLAMLILAPILFVVAEVTPKNLFLRRSEEWVYLLARSFWVFHVALRPVVFFLRGISRVVVKHLHGTREAARQSPLSRERVLLMFQEGRERGLFSSYQSLFAENIMELQSRPVLRTMKALRDAAMLPADASTKDLVQLARDSGLSRFPVFRDDRADVMGIVNVFDHLYGESEATRVRDMLHEPVRVSQRATVSSTLLRLLDAHQVMAIVVRPDGKAIGLVTIKDLIEEIVGELKDY